MSATVTQAQVITFRKVVDTNTPIPGGTGSFTQLDREPSIRGGDVAFRGAGEAGQIGVYTEVAGLLGVVADTSTAIPGGSGNFTDIGTTFGTGSVSFDGLSVAFRGLGSSGQDGIYTNEGGTLRVVADTTTAIPGGAGNFVGFYKDASIDAGSIALVGGDTTSLPFRGVYTEIGGVLSVVADTDTANPFAAGNYAGFDIVSLDGDDVAFRAFGTSWLGLVTHIGGVFNVVIDPNTPIPDGAGNFGSFGAPTMDAGNVVAIAGSPGALGAYTDLGGMLRVVADANTPVPGGSGNFGDLSFFGPLAAIDSGNIAFSGFDEGFTVTGVYAEMFASLISVVDTNDVLDGLSPIDLHVGPEALSGTELAFWAELSDGSEAVYVATIPLDVCGNGILEAGEDCDDQGESATCDADCTPAECGDGTLNVAAGEECDDGSGNSDILPDACRTDCGLASCGDGVVDSGEACDDGPDNSDTMADTCRLDCTPPQCGDGVVDSGEQCDDGNTMDGDGCRADCQLPICGDGILDSGEQCDDGAGNSDTAPDACRTNCTAARCGDGIVDSAEQCDDGAGNSNTAPDACRSDCAPPRCGDGVVDSGEQCDDGNQGNGDGCSASCEEEAGGVDIPTTSQWGVVIMGLLLVAGGRMFFRRRSTVM
jgi:cysteine-rich repeat protein